MHHGMQHILIAQLGLCMLWCPSCEQGGICSRVLGVSAMGADVCSWFSALLWGCLDSSLVPLPLSPLCYAVLQTTPHLQVLEPLVGGSGGEDIKQPNDLRKEKSPHLNLESICTHQLSTSTCQ